MVLVAMVTESSHRLIVGKWFNCIFSITIEVMRTMFGCYDHLIIVYQVYVLNDQWQFCLVAMAKLKQEICKAPEQKEDPVKHQQEKNLLHTSKERRHCLTCLLSGLVK